MSTAVLRQSHKLSRMGMRCEVATPDDSTAVFELERDSYPIDEAATLSQIEMRIWEAGQFFMCVFAKVEEDASNPNPAASRSLVGFINGTCVNGALTHESMSLHDPQGEVLCIHSVCVRASARRQGIATHMLRHYVRYIAETQPQIQTIMLISKAHLFPLYTACGFKFMGASAVVHGQGQWFDFYLYLDSLNEETMLQIDAFTSTAFKGNPACVCFSQRQGDESWMQALATENNLSETAFLDELEADDHYSLRWFAPNKEVDLCGHATLAAAHALYETDRVAKGASITFHTRSGLLYASYVGDGFIKLDFPSELPTNVVLSPDEENDLLQGLGITREDIVWVGRNRMDIVVWIETSLFEALCLKAIDMRAISRLECRGVILTAKGGKHTQTDNDLLKDFDYVCRFFAPRYGVDEDPVTGSAHCALAPLWALTVSPAPNSLMGYQASRRGGVVLTRLTTDREGEARVELIGSAITIFEATLKV